MKKIILVLALVLMCSGCAYRAINGIRIQGKKLDCTYNQLTQTYRFKGEQVQATLLRQSTCASDKTAQKVSSIYNLPDVKEGELSFDLDNAEEK